MNGPLDIDAIEQRWKLATKGSISIGVTPRLVDVVDTSGVPSGSFYVGTVLRQADSEFLGNAYEDVPLLIAEVRRLRERLDEIHQSAMERSEYD